MSDTRFDARRYIGEMVAITPKELRKDVTCKKGTPQEYKADAYLANVAVLSGPQKGVKYTDALIFGQALLSACKKGLERGDLPLVGELEYVESKNMGEDGNPRTYLHLNQD